MLVRFRFPGRNLLSTIVDLPLAIPTLVTGLAARGPLRTERADRPAFERLGIHVIFAPLGIELALLPITLPFVIRTVQPVLLELDPAEEEAAATLGANGWTTFRRVVLPAIRPAIAAGALLSFARAIGEFGSIVIVSGNITGKTLTAPVFIFQLTSQFRPEEAAAVATLLFAISFVLVLITDAAHAAARGGERMSASATAPPHGREERPRRRRRSAARSSRVVLAYVGVAAAAAAGQHRLDGARAGLAGRRGHVLASPTCSMRSC